jgi:DNA-binding NtrC family response regulator
VDDELLIRDLLYDFFQDQGWNITIAESAEKALQILKAKKVDLVLTDIKMPDMDGLSLTSRVREKYPDIPVVLMTGYPSIDTAVAGIRQKVGDYIIKPFNMNQLFKSVKAQLEDHSVDVE